MSDHLGVDIAVLGSIFIAYCVIVVVSGIGALIAHGYLFKVSIVLLILFEAGAIVVGLFTANKIVEKQKIERGE